ncbi:hypothetical protein [Bradyrhizobium elkanii]|uniref:hypothetical protein n=1 Tax=Bradyrhizobium elkanii TaxID=29448 RepID=UPI001BAD502A|nr:hypothetical protein [Bradyrhizobium elkanii]MBR1158802.1 hypothetical protein [Bradyrhizobium elkanii]
MTDRRCLSTAREGHIGATFRIRSIAEIRAIFDEGAHSEAARSKCPAPLDHMIIV